MTAACKTFMFSAGQLFSSSSCRLCSQTYLPRTTYLHWSLFSRRLNSTETQPWYVSFTEEEKKLFLKFQKNAALKRLMRGIGFNIPYKVATYSMFLSSDRASRHSDQKIRGTTNIQTFRNLSRAELEQFESAAREATRRKQQEFFKELLEAKSSVGWEQEGPRVEVSAWDSLICRARVSNFKEASQMYGALDHQEMQLLQQQAAETQDHYVAWIQKLPDSQKLAHLSRIVLEQLGGKRNRRSRIWRDSSKTSSRYSTWHAFLKTDLALKADRVVDAPGYMAELHRRNVQTYRNLDEESKQRLRDEVQRRHSNGKNKT